MLKVSASYDTLVVTRMGEAQHLLKGPCVMDDNMLGEFSELQHRQGTAWCSGPSGCGQQAARHAAHGGNHLTSHIENDLHNPVLQTPLPSLRRLVWHFKDMNFHVRYNGLP